MKTRFFISLLALIGLAFTPLKNGVRENIDKWILDYHKQYENLDIGYPTPTGFYDKEIVRILKDTFLINDPITPLKVQVLALTREQEGYTDGHDYSWNVSVGYGLVPGNGNFWEDVSVGRGEFLNEVKEYIMYKLIKNRSSQSQLYNWAKLTIISAWMSKSDTTQAMDMFAVWKAAQYLEQYDHQKELERRKAVYTEGWSKGYNAFTGTDWKGRDDGDAKIYAFWHRRITEYIKEDQGFSLEDARYWAKIALSDMRNNAKPNAKAAFNDWKQRWVDGNITSVPACRLGGECYSDEAHKDCVNPSKD